ncbi:hypothetical protein FKM82_002141 [Ascaphus truei]
MGSSRMKSKSWLDRQGGNHGQRVATNHRVDATWANRRATYIGQSWLWKIQTITTETVVKTNDSVFALKHIFMLAVTLQTENKRLHIQSRNIFGQISHNMMYIQGNPVYSSRR